MNRRSWVLLSGRLAALIALPIKSLAEEQTILHEGTPVRMRMNRTISSATEKEGDNVDFETLDDIKLGDAVVIPKGSTAMATVTDAATKKSMGRAGKLSVNIDYVRLPSGEKLPLRGVQDAKGGGHVGAMTGAIVATSIVFFPAAPLFLFVKGKDITIPKGHEVTVYTSTEYSPTKASKGGPSGSTAKITGAALTNADVLALNQAGLSDQLIIAKIQSSPASYGLETSDLVSLKQAGVADAIVSAMIDASKK
jgi:hypothetical protein